MSKKATGISNAYYAIFDPKKVFMEHQNQLKIWRV